MNRFALSLLELFLRTAIGFSIRIVERGITYCSFWPASCAPIASFSYVSRTSPLPDRKVFSESRALLSWTATCRKSWSSFACACALVFPSLSHAPYAAITFQRAPPDVNGFGVITWTPRLEEIVPALDVLRIAVANREGDERVGDDPLVGLLVPLAVDQPCLDERVHVGPEREGDDVGLEAGLHRPRLVAGGAVRLGEAHAASRRRALEHRDQLRVRLARRRVGDERQLDVLAGGAGHCAEAEGQRERDKSKAKYASSVFLISRYFLLT